jgi:hypothetical protein
MRNGDMETWRHGDTEIWRHGDKHTNGKQQFLFVCCKRKTGGLPGLSPLREDGSCGSQAKRLHCVSGG